MERGSDLHGRRLDEEMAAEVESIQHGAPVEARADEGRVKEDIEDAELIPEVLLAVSEDPAPGALSHGELVTRSELARHLRPSIYPATRTELIACARDENAGPELLELLDRLPEDSFETTESVWEALGGHREQRERPRPATTPVRQVEQVKEPPRTQRFAFRFEPLYRLAALPFLVTPQNSFIELTDGDERRLVVQFGPWRVATDLDNVAGVSDRGPFAIPKTIGPPHLSLADQGLTFATNHRRGVCITFRDKVSGIDPIGVVRHPGLTVTPEDP